MQSMLERVETPKPGPDSGATIDRREADIPAVAPSWSVAAAERARAGDGGRRGATDLERALPRGAPPFLSTGRTDARPAAVAIDRGGGGRGRPPWGEAAGERESSKEWEGGGELCRVFCLWIRVESSGGAHDTHRWLPREGASPLQRLDLNFLLLFSLLLIFSKKNCSPNFS